MHGRLKTESFHKGAARLNTIGFLKGVYKTRAQKVLATYGVNQMPKDMQGPRRANTSLVHKLKEKETDSKNHTPRSRN